MTPGLFREEKGRAKGGEVSGETRGANPPTSDPKVSGEFPSEVPCDWFHAANAGCGETTVGGGVGMPPFTNMGGVILTGDKMALGRGRLLELFTEETIRTGPFPTPPLVSSVSMASSSDPLDRSLPESPESPLLDELEVLDTEDEVVRPLRPFPVSGIRGGIPVAETVATRTLPRAREEADEEEEEEEERE